jgi:hypothetical protein
VFFCCLLKPPYMAVALDFHQGCIRIATYPREYTHVHPQYTRATDTRATKRQPNACM